MLGWKRTIRYAASWIRTLFHRFFSDDIPASSAQLTYYLILGIFPFLIFIINLLSYTPLSALSLTDSMIPILPADTVILIQRVLAETVAAKSTTLLSASGFLAIWSTSRAMHAINRGLNKAYKTPEKRVLWKNFLLALVFTVSLMVLVVLTLFLLVFGKTISQNLFVYFGASELFLSLWHLLRWVLPIIMMVFLFSSFYRFMPNRKVRYHEVWVGAIFSTLGWLLASGLFSRYVSEFDNYTKVYGSLGGIIIFLVWLYIGSMILMMGGEINATMAYFSNQKKDRQ